MSHDLNASFKLYPNPSNNGVVFVEPKNAEKGSIEVINILGDVVAREEQTSATVKLDLGVLPTGTYFVKYRSGNAIRSEKLIITK